MSPARQTDRTEKRSAIQYWMVNSDSQSASPTSGSAGEDPFANGHPRGVTVSGRAPRESQCPVVGQRYVRSVCASSLAAGQRNTPVILLLQLHVDCLIGRLNVHHFGLELHAKPMLKQYFGELQLTWTGQTAPRGVAPRRMLLQRADTLGTTRRRITRRRIKKPAV